MVIRFPYCPDWDVVVRRSNGLVVRDVFHAIWQTYNQCLTPEDKAKISPTRLDACERAFQDRCRMDSSTRQWETNQGMRRVDTLGKRFVFMGLRRPVNESMTDRYWELELGMPMQR